MIYNNRKLRHELKYYMDEEKAFLLRQLLQTVLRPDSNMKNPMGYLISSIYFDDMYNTAMEEKLSGANPRKKFRIRSYDYDDSFIRLECKEKYEQYISKISATLTRQEYDHILAGDYEVLRNRSEEVCRMFYVYTKTRLLHPVVVVEYVREAYVYPLGNVRITFDKEISASVGVLDVFSKEYISRRALDPGKIVLEVKYDDFLPAHIQRVVSLAQTQQCAVSKYTMCRDEKRKVEHV